MDPKAQIIKSLQKILGDVDIKLDIPERGEFGDYATNVALQLKNLKTTKQKNNLAIEQFNNPRELAEAIVSQLKSDKELSKVVDKIQVAGPGFINFHLKNDVLLNNLTQIDVAAEDYGKGEFLKEKKYVLEFAHPNTHKPFHIGHLRNITTGETLARIFSFSGANIKRINYQGDVGLHIAKAIWGVQKIGFSDPSDIQKRAGFLGDAYVAGNKAYEEDAIAKEEIHKINEALYKGEDSDLMDLYKKTRQWSLDYFDYIYNRVGTKFDRLFFESEVADEGLKLARQAVEKNILQESEGAVIFPGNEVGLHDRVFITSRGVPTYEGKDLGLAKLQFKEFNPDLLIHIVGPEQIEYFKVIFKALESIVPETKDKEVHIPYGWVRLKEGKMSSRTGNVVLGNWLLDEAKQKIIEKYKSDSDTAEKIAVGAVKYSFLKNGLAQEIAFDLNESLSLEGNSGPYLQYTYARTQSVLRKAHVTKKRKNEKTKRFLSFSVFQSLSVNPEELSLLRTLLHYPEVVESAASSYAPNLICNYLYDLAQKFNTFYNKHRIIEVVDQVKQENRGGEEKNLVNSINLVNQLTQQDFRLALTSSVGTVLKSGLDLLGIQAPERM